jgi:MarR family transcriptional regulator for hemolysin
VLKGITRADLEATLRVLNAFNASDAQAPASRLPDAADSAS